MDMPQLHRPLPRRAFDLTPISADSSKPPSPAAEAQNAELLMNDRSEFSPPPSRTRSILNLTSSTLLGIYSNATDGGRGDELNTPWGTGAQTPSLSHRQSADVDRLQVPSFPFSNETSRKSVVRKAPKKTVKNFYLPLLTQTIMLFAFGLGFGSLLTHLHKTQQITPMPVPHGGTNSRHYQIAWGILGVILGNALPQLDSLLDDDEAITGGFDTKTTQYQHIRSLSGTSQSGKERPSLTDNGLGPIWYSAVRSVGAFAGIAFALVCNEPIKDRIFTDFCAAKNPLAVNFTGFIDSSCCEPSFVVLDRPIQARSCIVPPCECSRHIPVPVTQPFICAGTEHLPRACFGEAGSISVASQHTILH